MIVGQHEANVVLKDNDLHVKISLAPFESYRVLDILKKDSDLLGELGVLDYSLLVGVKKKRFAVEVPDEEVRSHPLMYIVLPLSVLLNVESYLSLSPLFVLCLTAGHRVFRSNEKSREIEGVDGHG